jgi:hypothetical protein
MVSVNPKGAFLMSRITLSGVVVVTLFCVAMAKADPFEGTRWKVRVVPDEDARKAGEKEFDEVLSFKGGMFNAESCAKYGFKPVQYEDDTRRMGPAMFKAEPKSEKEGTAKWTGTVTATTIKGELVWTKKDGNELSYTYQGERMQK